MDASNENFLEKAFNEKRGKINKKEEESFFKKREDKKIPIYISESNRKKLEIIKRKYNIPINEITEKIFTEFFDKFFNKKDKL